jgi:hypothetical protein
MLKSLYVVVAVHLASRFSSLGAKGRFSISTGQGIPLFSTPFCFRIF